MGKAKAKTKAKASKALEIEHVGAIRHLEIPIPDEGGLVILRGPNGSGKSTALESAKRLLGGKVGNLTPTDGEPRGSVAIGAATLSVTPKRNAVRGELEVESIEGRFDVSDLIDPGIADPLRADAARIKALVTLTSAKVDVEPFIDLVGGKENWAKVELELDDEDMSEPLTFAKKVKRYLEKRSREAATEASEKEGEAKGLESQIDESIGEPLDDNDLLADIDSATSALASLEAKRSAFVEQSKAAAEAEEKIAQLSAGAASFDVEKHAAKLAEEELKLAEERLKIHNEEEALAKRKQQLEANEAKLSAGQDQLEMAKRHAEEIAALKQLSGASLPEVSEGQIEAARAAKAELMEKHASNAKAKEQASLKEKAAELSKEAKRQSERARLIREMAKDVEGLLADQVPMGVIKVENGRLVVATDRSDAEPYSELSHGERARIAIDVAADAAPEHGLIVIRQEVFEGLDSENREAISQRAKERGVTVLTAAVGDGEGIEVEQQ